MLATPTDPRNASEILVREDGVVVGQQGGALPLREGAAQERPGAVDAAVQAQADGGGAGVVGVLDHLLQDRGALGVVEQDLPDPPRQVDLLAEVLDEDRRGGRHLLRFPGRSDAADGDGPGSDGGVSRHGGGVREDRNREVEDWIGEGARIGFGFGFGFGSGKARDFVGIYVTVHGPKDSPSMDERASPSVRWLRF